MFRDETVCMMRVRNEGRWIRRSLERTWQVARSVVMWDDGSDDNTRAEAMHVLYHEPYVVDWVREMNGGVLVMGATNRVTGDQAELHYIISPFRPAANEMEEVSEIRDKNILWWYVKAQTPATYFLCMDGDEMFSLDALRHIQYAANMLDESADMLDVPFVYLWNDERTRRVDAIYGDRDGTRQGENSDGLPRLRFPRMFTTKRCDPYDVFEQRFAWHGHRQGRRVLGGFHCGSVPQENFHPNGGQPTRGVFPHPIIHFGYLHKEDRVKKHAWYNKIDPKNIYEGEYKHIIEEANVHAPGQAMFAPWEDA